MYWGSSLTPAVPRDPSKQEIIDPATNLALQSHLLKVLHSSVSTTCASTANHRKKLLLNDLSVKWPTTWFIKIPVSRISFNQFDIATGIPAKAAIHKAWLYWSISWGELQPARSHKIHFTSSKTHQIQQLICSGFKAAEDTVFHYKLPKPMHFHLWPHSLYFELHK